MRGRSFCPLRQGVPAAPPTPVPPVAPARLTDSRRSNVGAGAGTEMSPGEVGVIQASTYALWEQLYTPAAVPLTVERLLCLRLCPSVASPSSSDEGGANKERCTEQPWVTELFDGLRSSGSASALGSTSGVSQRSPQGSCVEATRHERATAPQTDAAMVMGGSTVDPTLAPDGHEIVFNAGKEEAERGSLVGTARRESRTSSASLADGIEALSEAPRTFATPTPQIVTSLARSEASVDVAGAGWEAASPCLEHAEGRNDPIAQPSLPIMGQVAPVLSAALSSPSSAVVPSTAEAHHEPAREEAEEREEVLVQPITLEREGNDEEWSGVDGVMTAIANTTAGAAPEATTAFSEAAVETLDGTTNTGLAVGASLEMVPGRRTRLVSPRQRMCQSTSTAIALSPERDAVAGKDEEEEAPQRHNDDVLDRSLPPSPSPSPPHPCRSVAWEGRSTPAEMHQRDAPGDGETDGPCEDDDDADRVLSLSMTPLAASCEVLLEPVVGLAGTTAILYPAAGRPHRCSPQGRQRTGSPTRVDVCRSSAQVSMSPLEDRDGLVLSPARRRQYLERRQRRRQRASSETADERDSPYASPLPRSLSLSQLPPPSQWSSSPPPLSPPACSVLRSVDRGAGALHPSMVGDADASQGASKPLLRVSMVKQEEEEEEERPRTEHGDTPSSGMRDTEGHRRTNEPAPPSIVMGSGGRGADADTVIGSEEPQLREVAEEAERVGAAAGPINATRTTEAAPPIIPASSEPHRRSTAPHDSPPLRREAGAAAEAHELDPPIPEAELPGSREVVDNPASAVPDGPSVPTTPSVHRSVSSMDFAWAVAADDVLQQQQQRLRLLRSRSTTALVNGDTRRSPSASRFSPGAPSRYVPLSQDSSSTVPRSQDALLRQRKFWSAREGSPASYSVSPQPQDPQACGSPERGANAAASAFVRIDTGVAVPDGSGDVAQDARSRAARPALSFSSPPPSTPRLHVDTRLPMPRCGFSPQPSVRNTGGAKRPREERGGGDSTPGRMQPSGCGGPDVASSLSPCPPNRPLRKREKHLPHTRHLPLKTGTLSGAVEEARAVHERHAGSRVGRGGLDHFASGALTAIPARVSPGMGGGEFALPRTVSAEPSPLPSSPSPASSFPLVRTALQPRPLNFSHAPFSSTSTVTTAPGRGPSVTVSTPYPACSTHEPSVTGSSSQGCNRKKRGKVGKKAALGKPSVLLMNRGADQRPCK